MGEQAGPPAAAAGAKYAWRASGDGGGGGSREPVACNPGLLLLQVLLLLAFRGLRSQQSSA